VNSRMPKIVFAALTGIAAISFSFYYARLPSVVASHFNANGMPNGWQAKPHFFLVFLAPLAASAFLVFGVPFLVRVLPMRLINLPHKEQWFSPELRAASLDFLEAWFAWFGCAVLSVIVLTFNYAVQSNMAHAHRPDPTRFRYILVGFGVFSIVWVIRIVTRFARPPEALKQ
jgi:uncharacterized membrane protein